MFLQIEYLYLKVIPVGKWNVFVCYIDGNLRLTEKSSYLLIICLSFWNILISSDTTFYIQSKFIS